MMTEMEGNPVIITPILLFHMEVISHNIIVRICFMLCCYEDWHEFCSLS